MNPHSEHTGNPRDLPSFDLARVPFSIRGSWLGINRLPPPRARELGKKPGLFVRTYRGAVPMAQREALEISLLAPEGSRSRPWRESAVPGYCRLDSKSGGSIEVTFASPSSLRLRGRGCSLGLRAASSAYDYARPAGTGRWELNLFSCRLQLMIRRLRGRVEVDAPWAEHRATSIAITVSPEHDKEWEIALDEFEAVWDAPADEPVFDEAVRRQQEAFKTWLTPLPSVSPDLTEARALAGYVMWSSLVAPSGHLQREAMLMSKNWMVNVWSWDHCFNALALATVHPELAWDQWFLPFDHQHRSGMIPDCVNDRDVVWNFTKPPVHGWALSAMISAGFRPSATQLRRATIALERWTQWWLDQRDDDQDGLPQYNHGNDSGWDNATLFGAGMPVEGPDLATFLVLQMETIADLRDRLGQPAAAARWRDRAEALAGRLIAHSWDGRRFAGLRSGDHRSAAGDSLIACLPLLLGSRLPPRIRRRLREAIVEPGRFLTAFGPATESPLSPLYQPDGYWRGPIWAPSTLLLVEGLRASGGSRLAAEIARRFARTVSAEGCAENFDALTGRGLRDRAYTWTASVFLILAARVRPGRSPA